MIFTRPAGAVMIFTRSRNAATGDNSMYCMIPDPFPSSAFGKGSATPDYILLVWSANDDAPFQGKVQVNLLNHYTYRWNCVTASYGEVRIKYGNP